MISGIFIIVMMVAFFAIVVWAWSDDRKAEFQHLSNLPLEDDFLPDSNGDNFKNIANKGEENGHV